MGLSSLQRVWQYHQGIAQQVAGKANIEDFCVAKLPVGGH